MKSIILLVIVVYLTFSSGQQDDCKPTFNIHQYNGPAPASQQDLPRDCTEVRDSGITNSGQYMISPQDDGPSFRVYCDMETDGGGWTVFQRREDGSVDFYRNWVDYETGFGNTNSEHWLGNAKIHRITAQATYELRVDMTDFEDNAAYAKYSQFRLADSGNNYTLIISGYSGNAGDSLAEYHGGYAFTTKDIDNDENAGNCADQYQGAWWYDTCHESNLNGLYLRGAHESFANGVDWKDWKGYNYSLNHVEMKIRIAS